VYRRDYAFRMNVMEEIFEIGSCIEILVNDIKETILLLVWHAPLWVRSHTEYIKYFLGLKIPMM